MPLGSDHVKQTTLIYDKCDNEICDVKMVIQDEEAATKPCGLNEENK